MIANRKLIAKYELAARCEPIANYELVAKCELKLLLL